MRAQLWPALPQPAGGGAQFGQHARHLECDVDDAALHFVRARQRRALAALRAWLTEVRSGARGRPVEAQLARGAKGYSGTITVTLPAAGSAL